MMIYEAQLCEELLEKLIQLSGDWESENSTYGYRKNDRSDIEGNRTFLAEIDGVIVGYLFGRTEHAERSRSIMPDGTVYFEVEELYVVPERRCHGIGSALFRFAELQAKSEGVSFLMLSTATKNYRQIMHFYIEEMGMEFWSARLFKQL